MAKQRSLFVYTFDTPNRKDSTSEQQNCFNRQEDAGMNSIETGCHSAAQQIQNRQVIREQSQEEVTMRAVTVLLLCSISDNLTEEESIFEWLMVVSDSYH